jgi:hypothetical protein
MGKRNKRRVKHGPPYGARPEPVDGTRRRPPVAVVSAVIFAFLLVLSFVMSPPLGLPDMGVRTVLGLLLFFCLLLVLATALPARRHRRPGPGVPDSVGTIGLSAGDGIGGLGGPGGGGLG